MRFVSQNMIHGDIEELGTKNDNAPDITRFETYLIRVLLIYAKIALYVLAKKWDKDADKQ